MLASSGWDWGEVIARVGALAGRLGMVELPVVEVEQPNRDQSAEEIAATASAAAPSILRQLVAG